MPTESPSDETSVLLCIPRLVGGGAERQVRLLLPRLVERGLRVSLFSRFRGEEAASLAALGIGCHPIAADGNHDPRLLVELSDAARRARAQVIHSWLTQMDVLGGAVALATGRKWILSERSSPDAYRDRVKDRARAQLGRRAHVIVANSAAGLDVWPDHPRRMIIPNGVDFEGIEGAAALADERVPAGRKLIVVAARLAPEKQMELVIRGMARLRPSHPDALLAIVGEGPDERALKACVARLGLSDHVVFTGFRPDTWCWIKASSVFVSASRFEGQPNAVLEAAAAGIPQVLSNIQMHRDAVGERGALFVDPADADSLAAAMAALIEMPALARRLAMEAEAAVEELSIGRAADLYAGLYRRTASGRPLLAAGLGDSWSSAA